MEATVPASSRRGSSSASSVRSRGAGVDGCVVIVRHYVGSPFVVCSGFTELIVVLLNHFVL